MELARFLDNNHYEVIQGSLNKYITSISYNSNTVTKGGAFVAIKGFSDDGHNYIYNAIKNGATVIFIQNPLSDSYPEDVTIVQVDNTRILLARLSKQFYKNPSNRLKVVGITGTNGKTSISKFLNSIHMEANNSVATLGTNGLFINNRQHPFSSSTATTPESTDVQNLFQKLVCKNIHNVVMEVSSHSLELHRVTGIDFHTGIFVNLTPDHLELHKTLDNYFYAKSKLFDLTTKNNIINIDDPYGEKLAEMCKVKGVNVTTVGIHSKADIRAKNIKYSLYGSTYTIQTPTYELDIKVQLPGEIYVYNSLLAFACAYVNNIPKQTIKIGIEKVEKISGRFNIIYEEGDFRVIIDFAHTEDGLKNLLKTVKPFVKGRLILVFGVYADMSQQGREKRINMGKVAGQYADLSVITLDNPKHFDQNIIINQIVEGIKSNKEVLYKTILDRKKAIQYAISQGSEQDIIVIAGKGHERYQIINDKQIYLNEEEIVFNELRKKQLI